LITIIVLSYKKQQAIAMAFVRVKRRHNEDPYDSIVVSHKKLKTIGAELNRDCVFQFAATLKDEVSFYALL